MTAAVRPRSSRRDIAIGLLSQATMVGSTLILLPFLVRTLSEEQVGIWYVYLTIQGAVFLLDLGATQTFVRFFGYVFGGATDLRDGVVPAETHDGKVHLPLLAALLDTTRRVYGLITLVAVGLMLTAGTYGIHALTRDLDLPEAVWPSWVVFAVTMALQTYFQWQGPPLIGSGQTRRNYAIAARSRLVQVIASVAVLLVAPSLLALSLAFALSAAVMRIDYYLALRPMRSQLAGVTWSRAQFGHLPRVVWRSARQLAGMVIGVAFASRFVALAVAWYAGVAISARYSIANQALVALNSVAMVAQTTYGPRIARARVAGDTPALRAHFSLSLSISWLIYLAGGLALLTVLPWLLDLIGSRTSLPPWPVLLLLIAIFTLEMNMIASTQMISLVSNTVPYARALLLSGIVVAVAVMIVGELGMGLMAILAVQLGVQSVFNLWYWPKRCFALLSLRAIDVPRRLAGVVAATLRRT